MLNISPHQTTRSDLHSRLARTIAHLAARQDLTESRSLRSSSPPSDTTTKAPTARSGPSSYGDQAVGARPTESMRVAKARQPAGCRWMWSDQVQVDRCASDLAFQSASRALG